MIWLQAVLEKYAEVLPLRVVELDPQWGKGSGQVCLLRQDVTEARPLGRDGWCLA